MRKAAKNLRRPPASLYRRDIAAAECRRGLDRIDVPFAAVSRRVEVGGSRATGSWSVAGSR